MGGSERMLVVVEVNLFEERETNYPGVPLSFIDRDDNVSLTAASIRGLVEHLLVVRHFFLDRLVEEVVVGEFGDKFLHGYFLPGYRLHCYFYFADDDQMVFTVGYDGWPGEQHLFFAERFDYPEVKVDGFPYDVELWQPQGDPDVDE